jgi:ornithine--oxo-acid transaminase
VAGKRSRRRRGSTDPLFHRDEAPFGAHMYEPRGMILSRDEGVWVWDAQGKRYLDCISAY